MMRGRERERERESGRMVVFLRRRRRGRRKPGRVGAAEIPAESYDVQPGTAGGAREGIRTISLSLRVDAGAAGVEDVSFGGSCAGEGSIPSKISLSGELERFRFAGLALDLFSPFLLPLSPPSCCLHSSIVTSHSCIPPRGRGESTLVEGARLAKSFSLSRFRSRPE